MHLVLRSGWLGFVLALGAGQIAHAQGVDKVPGKPSTFTTAEGSTLALPPIDQMECEEMERVLALIDSTGYRRNAPTPHDAADAPLYEYELALAEENYHRCVIVLQKLGGGLYMIRRSRSQ